MTVPTKAAMKQLLDERMIAGSASNRLPLAMFFLQLNLSGVIILLSLMFYANALGESFVRGLVVVFFSFPLLCDVRARVQVWFKGVWCCACVCEVEVVRVRRCMRVVLFLSTLKIFAFLWTLPVLPWLFPVCIRVFSHGDHRARVTSHARLKRRELASASSPARALSVGRRGLKDQCGEERTDMFMHFLGCRTRLVFHYLLSRGSIYRPRLIMIYRAARPICVVGLWLNPK